MKPHTVFVGLFCFCAGMLLGQSVGYSNWWGMLVIAAGLLSMALLHVPLRCKKRLQLRKTRKTANSH
jgi:hypothetical protein